MIKKYLSRLLILIVSAALVSCSSSTQPDNVGKDMTTPSACPDSPNCVSTKSTDKEHSIENIKYTSTLEDANQRIIEIINSMKRTKIVVSKPSYIYATFTTKLFKFVDDVEIFFDDSLKVIHFRSASRVGYSDMGLNRKRMEEVRNLFENK